jgi:hypothetical protein
MRVLSLLLAIISLRCSPVATAAVPEQLFALAGSTVFAITSDYVYGGTAGALWRLKHGGTSPETLPSATGGISDLSADANGIAYTAAPLSDANTKLRRAGADGTGATDVASNVLRGSVRMDASALYWIDGSTMPPAIMSASRNGGAATKLCDVEMAKPELTVDDTYVYFADFTAPTTVKRVPKAGGAVENVKVNTVPASLQNDAASLYYLDRASTGLERVLVLAKAGGDPTELVQDAAAFFVEDRYVYFSAVSAMTMKQSLARVAKTGKLQDVLVQDVGVTTPLTLAAGYGWAYWSDGRYLSRLAVQ